MLQTVLAQPPGGGPGSDTTAARLTDARFFGIERVDLRAKYGAPLDGASHSMTQAAALAAYPNCGATGSIEQDTAAFLQAEYDLRTGAGGIIGLPDGAQARASQTWWLKNGGKVHLHGGRFTAILGEGCGTAPVVRISNASGNTSGAAIGPGQPICLRNVTLFAWNQGRAYFSAGGGAGAPGYATAAAMAGNPGGYRTGSCAVQIDDGGAAGQSSGLSGPASVYATIEAVRCFNFDETIRWGDNTFSMILRNFMAENNNRGLSWSQTAGLNSMERMLVEGGSLSNNNYGIDINATWTDGGGAHPQGGSWFVDGVSIDYNLVSQGRIILAPSGNAYPQSSFHASRCHIESNAATLGAAAPWFSLQGVGKWVDNEWYINGAAPTTGLVLIGDNSSGTAAHNRFGGYCPIFTSTTSAYKEVHCFGNTMQPVNRGTDPGSPSNFAGTPIIALRDAAGTALQQRSGTDAISVDWYADNFILDAVAHGNMDDLFISTGCTKLTLPGPGAASCRVRKSWRIHNKSTGTVTTQVPVGVFSAGMGGYADNTSGSATITGPVIPANSIAILTQRSMNQWTYMGGFAASQPS